MSCALTQGYVLDCRDSVGGLVSAYFIEWDNVASVTQALGIVTAIANVTAKRFWHYKFVKETANAKETITANDANGSLFYAQDLQFILNKMQANTRNEIMLLAKNRLMIVGVDANGKGWLYGADRAMTLSAGDATTGAASGDRNGYSLTFAGKEPLMAPEVNAGTMALLETPGV